MITKLVALTFPIFLAIDMVWLGLVARTFYKNQIGFLMKSDVNWVAALLLYVLFVVGLVVFVISPAVEKGSWTQALLLGAFFGLVSYATYDLTNLATVKDWPLLVTVVDLVWGTVLGGLTSAAATLLAGKLGL